MNASPPTPAASPAADPKSSRLTNGTCVSFGVSAFGENLALNSVVQLAFPVFNLTLGVNPALIGLALALPRLWDAFTDPLMGSISDNFRSRWGRRRPFIIVGAILTAIFAAGIWQAPTGQSEMFYFWWLFIGSMLMATSFTVFIVPYGALGLELTSDYHERTRLMAIKSAFNKTSGLINQWMFKLVLLGVFPSMIIGARVLGGVVGVIIATVGLITGLKVKERPELAARSNTKLSLWTSWLETMRQRDFMSLAFAQVLIYTSILLVDNLGFYLNVFYVNGGDTQAGALLKGASGTFFQVGGLLFIPYILKLSRRLGKKRTFRLCLGSIVIWGIAKWFCYVPGAGWWMVLPSFLLAPGLVAVLVLVPSMTADVCDLDEAKTHARREGMFNAVSTWLLKFSSSITIFFSGYLLTVVGWKTELGAAQSPETYQAMRVAFSLCTILLAVVAGWALSGFNVDQERIQKAREASGLAGG